MSEYAGTCQNPLYEKLYHRFSCSGKTVGEVMLARAREVSGGSAESVNSCDITSEMRITHANFLPQAEGGVRSATRISRPFFTLNRINPSAALALLLSILILAYLLFAGIRHNSDTSAGLHAAAAAEIVESVAENTPET